MADVSLPGCKPHGPRHGQQIDQPGDAAPPCWEAANVDAVSSDLRLGARDKDSEGRLAGNPRSKCCGRAQAASASGG